MLKPKITLLVTATNVTQDEVCGIPAGESRIVFADVVWFLENSSNVISAFGQGLLEARDIAGNLLTAPLAGGVAIDMATEAQGYYSMKGFPTFPSYAKTVELHWNLSAIHTVVDTIGADILSTDLAALGTTKAAILADLEPAIELVELGMFTEGAAAARAITPTAFLTSSRLEVYASMLESANAIR